MYSHSIENLLWEIALQQQIVAPPDSLTALVQRYAPADEDELGEDELEWVSAAGMTYPHFLSLVENRRKFNP